MRRCALCEWNSHPTEGTSSDLRPTICKLQTLSNFGSSFDGLSQAPCASHNDKGSDGIGSIFYSHQLRACFCAWYAFFIKSSSNIFRCNRHTFSPQVPYNGHICSISCVGAITESTNISRIKTSFQKSLF